MSKNIRQIHLLSHRPTLGAVNSTCKRRYNALIQLPPEILGEIFQAVASSWVEQPNYVWNRSWISISYVCSQWRTVALRLPNIWAYINLSYTSPRWVMELLARSRTSPLAIVAQAKHVSTPIFKTLLKYSARFRMFSLSGYSGAVNEAIEWLNGPANILHKLTFNFENVYDENKIPADIFAGTIPRLRELELRNCSISLDLHFLRNLTSLCLHNMPVDGRPSISQVVNLLKHTAALENLTLSAILSSSPEDHPNSSTRQHVTLQHLKHFVIHDNITQCTKLIQGITYPSDAIVTLRSRTPASRPSEEELSRGMFNIQELGTSLNKDQHFLFLHVGLAEGHRIELRAWDALASNFQTPEGKPKLDVLLSLRRVLSSHRDQSPSALKAFWTGLPLCHLVSLRVDYDCRPFYEDIWLSVANLNGLKCVNVAEYGQGLVSALSINFPNDPPVFSPLHTLVIEGWKFGKKETTTTGSRTSLQELIHCLKTRRHLGHIIGDLFIRNSSGIDAANVEELRGLVENLTWDNFTDSDTEAEECSNRINGMANGEEQEEHEEFCHGLVEESEAGLDSDDDFELPMYSDSDEL